jgi:hypothetical protein
MAIFMVPKNKTPGKPGVVSDFAKSAQGGEHGLRLLLLGRVALLYHISW